MGLSGKVDVLSGYLASFDGRELGQPPVFLDKNWWALPTILKLNTTGENSRLSSSLIQEDDYSIRSQF